MKLSLEWSMDDCRKDSKNPPYTSSKYSSLEFIATQNLKSSYHIPLHTLQLPFTTHTSTQVQLPKDREQVCDSRRVFATVVLSQTCDVAKVMTVKNKCSQIWLHSRYESLFFWK
jgi:hypothetical protein